MTPKEQVMTFFNTTEDRVEERVYEGGHPDFGHVKTTFWSMSNKDDPSLMTVSCTESNYGLYQHWNFSLCKNYLHFEENGCSSLSNAVKGVIDRIDKSIDSHRRIVEESQFCHAKLMQLYSGLLFKSEDD